MLVGSVKAKTLILADENGAPRARVEDPEGRLRSSLGSYQVLSTIPDLLILRRQADGAGARPPGRVLMAGEILGSSTIIDVVSVIISSRWSGTLHVYGADAHRTFGFDKTALVHAKSDHPEDRLDKIMFRIGVLTPAQAEAVMREVKPGQRFGEVLIERGLIERRRLFEHLQRQMEEVFFSAVLERRGAYLFSVLDQAAASAALISHLPAQQLLMSAAERLDQVRDFQKMIPDDRMRPELAPEVDLTKLRPRSRLALSYCDGQRTLSEIARETSLGRFHTLRIVHRFLLLGQVRVLPPARTTSDLAEGLAAPFAGALREVFSAVERNGKLSRLRRELDERIDASEHRDQLKRVLDDEGEVDREAITEWLAGLRIRDRVELVGHTLHELASFALFNASLNLPRSEERELARKVQEHLAQLCSQ